MKEEHDEIESMIEVYKYIMYGSFNVPDSLVTAHISKAVIKNEKADMSKVNLLRKYEEI